MNQALCHSAISQLWASEFRGICGSKNLLYTVGDIRPASLPIANNYCCSSNESTPSSKTRPTGDVTDQGNHGPLRGKCGFSLLILLTFEAKV
jgi:hypothetical protein